MDDSLKDFRRQELDVSKLHSEVNQFRNQEFWVCSFAIAILGSSLDEIISSPAIGAGILAILLGLFFWHYTITDTRSRVTSYLKAMDLSLWEIRYREFANRITFSSQRKAALLIFSVLGGIVLIASLQPLIKTGEGGFWKVESQGWLVATGMIQVCYQMLVWIFGCKNYAHKSGAYEAQWIKIRG
jgi:hypothetical protein